MNEVCVNILHIHASSPKYLRLRSMPTEATKLAFLPNLTPVTKPVWSGVCTCARGGRLEVKVIRVKVRVKEYS